MPKTTFKTVLKGFGNNTGIEIPKKAIDELGSGMRPPVTVTIERYTYKSTVGAMRGMSLVSLPKAHREAAGLKAGDEITVTLELDEGIREVEVPNSLQTALISAKIYQVFSILAYSKRKEFARQVNDAKTDETRDRRIAKIIEALKS